MAVGKRRFESPDEVRPAGAGKAEIVKFGDVALMRVTLQPGWKWSNDVKPIAHTDSCQAHHLGYMFSGQMHIAMSDGSEADLGSGDVIDIPPGHDAWVVGNEPAVSLDITGSSIWAKPS